MNTKENITELTLRSAHWDDVQAVAKLIYDVCVADGDATNATTPAELEHQWREGSYNPETDAFVVETSDNRIIGFWEMFNEKDHAELYLDGYIHPNFKESLAPEILIRKVEERAMQELPLAPVDACVFMRSMMDVKDQHSRALHERFGYTVVRYFWRMEIKLESALTPVSLAEGLEIRSFIKEEHATAIWMADNEAFREHWGAHDRSFEEWSFLKFENPEFNPELWLVAWDGDQIAGFSQNRYRNGIGWVGTLGVRKAWRHKGLGLALLTHSFADFYKRGTNIIGLGVDAENTTGATRLYKKAGMSVANEYVAYEKELRAGTK